ncbi:MAG: type II secretion system protein GspK [Methylococcales bacterium]|nr:type II secretion system protein GspK [Methylococcales bacterium]
MIRQRGMAMVLVLWVLSILIIMAGSFALSMRREAAIVSVIKNNAHVMAIAESGLALAEMMLLNPDPNKVWRADGNIYEIVAADAKIRIRLLSETGKIDINKADQAALQSLMAFAPVDSDQQSKLVNAILDWRDADDLVHIDGAEKEEYLEAGLKYEPRNKPFESTEELQLILGMNKSVLAWLDPLVTVYSKQPHVNYQVATKQILQTIPGLDEGIVDSYVAMRLDSAKNNLPVPPFPVSTGGINNAAGQDNILTLVSEAITNDGSKASLSVVIKKSDNNGTTPFQILKWQHVTANNVSLFTAAMSELVVKQYAEPELNN